MSDASSFIPELRPSVNVQAKSITRRKFGRIGTRVLRLFRVSPDLKFNLDELGAAAVHLIDGRTVGEILAAMQERFPAEENLGSRLGIHLAALVENRFITIHKPGT